MVIDLYIPCSSEFPNSQWGKIRWEWSTPESHVEVGSNFRPIPIWGVQKIGEPQATMVVSIHIMVTHDDWMRTGGTLMTSETSIANQPAPAAPCTRLPPLQQSASWPLRHLLFERTWDARAGSAGLEWKGNSIEFQVGFQCEFGERW